MGNRWWAVLWLWLLPMRGEATASSESEAAAPKAPTRSWSSLARLEVATLALLPRSGRGRAEGFVQLEPTLILDGGPEFGLNLGAPVRLRAWGGAGRVRREDWDRLSDWGQLVRGLKLGSDAAPVGVWLGALEDYSLLSAHLVRRYSNRTNPDYHPAGGLLTGTVGPLYTEAFASDVLGARLMGAEVALDVGRVLLGAGHMPGRYTLAVSAVHDWGRFGGNALSVTLAHLDATAVVLRRPGLEAHLLAGWGGRPGVGGAWGAVLGVGADSVTPTRDVSLRLEARRQHGGFRQGFFGSDYELARFQAVGLEGVPLTSIRFPDGYSLQGEARVGWDAVGYRGLQRHLMLSLSVEAFSWGRLDVDGRVAVQLLERNLEVAVKGLGVGLGQPGARYLGVAEARWRIAAGKLYAVATGGTLLFPEGDGTLRPGAFASVGLGVDDAR
ncbi:hypothetical protein G4177_18895 [Corallococcus sp. ZKHCc1 1396]|uniref:DUF5723 domain-containing protein n=1 Tax=Corallococcus soli TaxID=2710757 RepID=A0ABR9PQR6_9BACT|nr:hypothetical protein [Corallococcus soli]MBE4750235.1 hypothetical protein [Corallococcus soli]